MPVVSAPAPRSSGPVAACCEGDLERRSAVVGGAGGARTCSRLAEARDSARSREALTIGERDDSPVMEPTTGARGARSKCRMKPP